MAERHAEQGAAAGAALGAGAPFDVLVLNRIAPDGLARLAPPRYRTGGDLAAPQAIVLRSADLHAREIPPSVLAVARAGAGTNNIPVDALTARGVPVFNAPGANANAVKELVIAGMLLAARRLPEALAFSAALDLADPALERTIEDGKKAFAGFELAGQTLGVIGLGKIGCEVADAAIALGMQVLGHDPEITVDAAWRLPSQVRRAASVDEVLRASRFVSLHVPLLAATRHLVDTRRVALMRADAVLLNFSRAGVVDAAAVAQALAGGRLARYVCDFPAPALRGVAGAIALPHLGASTAEAERNSAVMVIEQLRAFLEDGQVTHAVNFPACTMARESDFRVAIANANVPNMLGQISTAMAEAGLNIHNMVNHSRGEVAYTLVDVDSVVEPSVLAALRRIDGVLSVRYLPRAG
jgi:D-3-phosphoglycerate dehydrogenase / 2-oxoglutarate reductase